MNEPLIMGLLGTGIGLVMAGGCLAWLAGSQPRLAAWIATCSCVGGCALTLWSAVVVLATGRSVAITVAWPLPMGSVSLGIDPLSAVFIVPIGVVVSAAAVYGRHYLDSPHYAARGGILWLFFNLLAATMLLVVTARDGLFFLMAWEGMSLASFFLIMGDHERAAVRRAGWIYLVAMHGGTACLLVLFLLLGRQSGQLDFGHFSVGSVSASALFLLAVVGFGTKAGLMPLHVWLPEAHPAAPSHVSAVMSGVMIKTGIYGLLRTLTFLGPPAAWWGWTLVTIGVLSGVLGVVYALAQHDLKRLLAYSSVENVGIIAMGIGVGLLGVTYAIPAMAFLGFLGALLHMVNHALFKSLLFLGAGAVQHSTGTRDMNLLGGLLKRMPVTGRAFLVGVCAISGLPPLNGFLSEFLIYLGVLQAVVVGKGIPEDAAILLCVLVTGGLALIGGLSAACFTKAMGSVFLGEPRSPAARDAHEVGRPMCMPLAGLAGLCLLVAMSAPAWPTMLKGSVYAVIPAFFGDGSDAWLLPAVVPLRVLSLAAGSLLVIVAALVFVRRRLLAGRDVQSAGTWDCGYAGTVPRAQYTGSSFVGPLVNLFRIFLRARHDLAAPEGFFPQRARYESQVGDVFHDYLYQPAFLGVAWSASKLRWLQQGRIQLYVLYIALTVLVLLIWKLG
ncbi:MAG: proton-conducting transporter transmembrane domain-containing protein [Pirellulaceae bacterium]